ncbi:MAG: hypothetical protein ACRD50_00795 [Candidatus Acidiferrales bacterium]
MLRIFAEKYVALGQDFQELEMLAESATVQEVTVISANPAQGPRLSESEMETLVQLFFRVKQHCEEIGLKVSAKIAEEVNQVFSRAHFLTLPMVGARVAELRRCFIAELGGTLCYMILSGRGCFYTEDPLTFLAGQTLAKFPSIKFDIVEAGKCFATERFTACVGHLVKVAEYAFVSFVRFSKLGSDAEKNWNTGLNQIHKTIGEKKGPFENLTRTDEQYFVGLEGYLRAFNTAWRNPASHIPVVFTEAQAGSMFEIVKTLMNFASQKLSEVRLDLSRLANAKPVDG